MKHIITIAACLTMTALLNAQTIIRVTPTGTGDGTSWANACNLETAVVSTSLNDQVQIWVQSGIYYPSKMLVILDSVKIYGGFAGTENNLSQRNFSANPTIIDGQQKIGSIFRLENFAEINGFTIQNGNAQGNPYKNGGGIWANENSIIEDCKIIDNTAILNGGGIYANGKVKIINGTIENNVANGNGINTFGNCMTIRTHQTVSPSNAIMGCNNGILDLGNVYFKTSKVWTISANGINQEWSDVVMADGCNKTSFNDGAFGNYNSDCRANPDRSTYGDLFSWCAVLRYADVLCPDGWRVPSIGDFGKLDVAMGGSGYGSVQSDWGKNYADATIRNRYLNTWGGAYGGRCTSAGMYFEGTLATFWSKSEYDMRRGFFIHIRSSAEILPQGFFDKFIGCSLRCVR